MKLLRHGGMARLITGIYASSTLGSFVRTFAFGHVPQRSASTSPCVLDARRI